MYLARLQANWPVVAERIARSAERARRAGDVAVVVVTKGHPPAAVEAVRQLGIGPCGENRVQELEEKVQRVGRHAVEWHLVGHLQRNKVQRALPLFDLIQSIDSPRLARELSRQAEKSDVEVRGLVQVNTSGEATKGGFDPGEVVAAVGQIGELPRIRVLGLMTMAPLTRDAGVLHRTFCTARELFERCDRELASFEAKHLSMGMTNDYEIAVEEGSTMVRLGTALLGERET